MKVLTGSHLHEGVEQPHIAVHAADLLLHHREVVYASGPAATPTVRAELRLALVQHELQRELRQPAGE